MPEIDATGRPFDFKGATYVALAPAVRQMGGTVNWDNGTKKATVSLDGRTAEVQMANDQATADGQPVRLTAPPLVVDDTLIVPRTFFADVLGRAI